MSIHTFDTVHPLLAADPTIIPEIDPYEEEELDDLFDRLERGDPPKENDK